MTVSIAQTLAPRVFACILAGVLACSHGRPIVVGMRSAGPLKYGMTLDQASHVLAETLKVRDSSCDMIESRALPGIGLLILRGYLERVDIDTTGIATPEGIEVGATEHEVRRAYARLRSERRPYDDEDTTAHDLWVIPTDPADSLFGLVFETKGRQVTNYRAGRRPAVQFIEGCS